MRKFFEELWIISVMPIALGIPVLSVILLPFQALNNFLIGLFLGFIIIYFTIRDFKRGAK